MRHPYLTPARQRQRLRWLIREYGLPLVAAPTGLAPVTIARFIAGDELSPKSRAAIDRAFRELGFVLGLATTGAPELAVIPGGRSEEQPQ